MSRGILKSLHFCQTSAHLQKARDLHRQIEADILAFESNLARGISEEEQEVFLRVAKKMQENLREDLAKQGISICKGGDCE